MNKYRLIKKQGEGTFSEVFKAQSLKSGSYVAIKCMKSNFANMDQVNNLREIQALKRLSSHPHIIKMIEVIYDEPTGRLAIVFELMEQNLYEAIKGRKSYLPEKKIKLYMYQLLKALDFMHRSGVFHRDIKPENILLKEDHLVLADLGSCKGIYSKPPFTEYISTRWYRAPECLLTDGYYNYKMDMWGVGCVHFEVSSLFPIFPGDNELDQIGKIQNILGPPSIEVINMFKKNSSNVDFNFSNKQGLGVARFLNHISSDCVDLILKLLVYHPDERLSAKQALSHPYFKDLVDQENKMSKMSMVGFNPIMNFMKSFHNPNDSQSDIKSTDGSHYQYNPNLISHKKFDKLSILPDIKVNIIFDANQKNRSDSDDSDAEPKNITYLKLPKITKAGAGTINDTHYNHLKMTKNANFISGGVENKCNNSMEIQINTQYSKQNIKSMGKKMSQLKKQYVSPYSQKMIFNQIKV